MPAPRLALLGALALAALCLVPTRAGAQDVDLLRAVATDLAVSSTYRNQRSQVASLVDGSLETAWNSRTGELAGAWIEVRIPASARVSAIQLTAGFTHVTPRADLFPGNHRVRRVRVSRDGVVLGEHTLEVESRALQSLPVSGPGGVYRVEIVEVLPGSRTDWREVCISELRVLGSDAAARAGRRLPRTAVGALPPPRVATPPDRAALGRAHRQRVAAIERRWLELERLANGGREGSAPDDLWGNDVAEIERIRRAVLTETAAFVEPVDEVEADGLRIAALTAAPTSWPEWQHAPQLTADLEALARAMGAAGNYLADDAARCRWARTLGRIHLARAASFARAEREHGEMDEADGVRQPRGGPDLWMIATTLTDAEQEWSRNTRGVAARLRRMTMPADLRSSADFQAVLHQCDVAQATCGWP